jgi:hypothetical protein
LCNPRMVTSSHWMTTPWTAHNNSCGTSFIHSFYIPCILVGRKLDRCGISLRIHIINGIKYICLESMCHIKTITICIY